MYRDFMQVFFIRLLSAEWREMASTGEEFVGTVGQLLPA